MGDKMITHTQRCLWVVLGICLALVIILYLPAHHLREEQEQPHQIEGRAPQYQMGPALGEYLQQKQREESATVSSPSLLHSFGNGLMRFVSSLTPQHVESVNSLLRLWKGGSSSHAECNTKGDEDKVTELREEIARTVKELMEIKKQSEELEEKFKMAKLTPDEKVDEIDRAEDLLRKTLALNYTHREELSNTDLIELVQMTADELKVQRQIIDGIEAIKKEHEGEIPPLETDSLADILQDIIDHYVDENIKKSKRHLKNLAVALGIFFKDPINSSYSALATISVSDIQEGIEKCINKVSEVKQAFLNDVSNSIKAILNSSASDTNYWIKLPEEVKALKMTELLLERQRNETTILMSNVYPEFSHKFSLTRRLKALIDYVKAIVRYCKENFNSLSEDALLAALVKEQIKKIESIEKKESEESDDQISSSLFESGVAGHYDVLDLSYRPGLYIQAIGMAWSEFITPEESNPNLNENGDNGSTSGGNGGTDGKNGGGGQGSGNGDAGSDSRGNGSGDSGKSEGDGGEGQEQEKSSKPPHTVFASQIPSHMVDYSIDPVNDIKFKNSLIMNWKREQFYHHYADLNEGFKFAEDYMKDSPKKPPNLVAYSLYKKYVAAEGVLVVATIRDSVVNRDSANENPGILRVNFKNEVNFEMGLSDNENAFVEFELFQRPQRVLGYFDGFINRSKPPIGYITRDDGKTLTAFVFFSFEPRKTKLKEGFSATSPPAKTKCQNYHLDSKYFLLKSRYHLSVDQVCEYIGVLCWEGMSLDKNDYYTVDHNKMFRILSEEASPKQMVQAYVLCSEARPLGSGITTRPKFSNSIDCKGSKYEWDLDMFVFQGDMKQMEDILDKYA
eukprot:Nk52_evm22s153 gene=Nk52_evmTU22s153